MLPFDLFLLALNAAKPITGPWPQAFPAKSSAAIAPLSIVYGRHLGHLGVRIPWRWNEPPSRSSQQFGRGREYSQSNLAEAHFGVHSNILLSCVALACREHNGRA